MFKKSTLLPCFLSINFSSYWIDNEMSPWMIRWWRMFFCITPCRIYWLCCVTPGGIFLHKIQPDRGLWYPEQRSNLCITFSVLISNVRKYHSDVTPSRAYDTAHKAQYVGSLRVSFKNNMLYYWSLDKPRSNTSP